MSFLLGQSMTGGYGRGADILHDCTIGVERGEIAVIVGPNGAGKSTAMKAVFGMLDLREGRVTLGERDITDLSPQDRVAEGMAFVPQNRNVFPSLTVEENLEMGAFLRRDGIRETMGQVYDLFPVLKEKRRQAAGELSGGQRQQVAVGRALMTETRGADARRAHRGRLALSSWTNCSTASSRSRGRGSRSSWSSRTRARRSRSLTRATCWCRVPTDTPTPARRCWPTRRSDAHSSEAEPMRLLLLLALLLPGMAAADALSCTLTRACVQGGPCVRAQVPLFVRGADGARPQMQVDGVLHPVDRERNYFGTVYHGWNNARRPVSHPGELWVRPNGRSTYIRRADVRGVLIRTDYRGRCVLVPELGAAGAEALK